MRSASPPSWPRESFTSLKSSTSMKRTASCRARRSLPGPNEAARREVNEARLGSPVSVSWVASQGESQVTVMKGSGHAVEGLGQFAQLVVA